MCVYLSSAEPVPLLFFVSVFFPPCFPSKNAALRLHPEVDVEPHLLPHLAPPPLIWIKGSIPGRSFPPPLVLPLSLS